MTGAAAPPDPRDELPVHLPALRAFALSLTRNGATADDMVQDTLVKAWTSIDKFQPGTNLRAWLFTILRNTYYSSRRKAAREVADVDGVFTASLSQKPDHDGRLQMADFKVAFAQLPDEQREALILVGASGFAYEEAAEMCGVAVGTIKSRVNRGRARLTKLDLTRFRSGLLRAILAIKETGYGNDTQRRVQTGCGSHRDDQWPDKASGCV